MIWESQTCDNVSRDWVRLFISCKNKAHQLGFFFFGSTSQQAEKWLGSLNNRNQGWSFHHIHYLANSILLASHKQTHYNILWRVNKKIYRSLFRAKPKIHYTPPVGNLTFLCIECDFMVSSISPKIKREEKGKFNYLIDLFTPPPPREGFNRIVEQAYEENPKDVDSFGSLLVFPFYWCLRYCRSRLNLHHCLSKKVWIKHVEQTTTRNFVLLSKIDN